ncbi:RhoGEF domain protein [Dictyocaulus viviparus]|uniref:RhoGEF domain protein n=1 Tax=Dictyocaulus viviparus TaxID=29172 RepID=A0A0D8XGN3_DICVI|nr:RhoGEF domain protein [Dictyocaulus viviparus]
MIRLDLMCSLEGNELWKECVRWMVDMGVLDQRIAPTNSMLEFATMLRDGVLLCRLLNDLAPGCIEEKDIQRRPHMSEFTCHKNICLFLGTCKTVFHLKQEQMFEAWELFRLQDFAKVLSVLSMLSYSEPALQKNIRPFPCDASSSSAAPLRLFTPPEEEAIYRSLQDDVEKVDLDDAIYDISPLKNDEEEPQFIYDHIVCRKDSFRKHDVWSSFSPSSKREHCMKELLDTEQNYVEKALNMIINKFYEPLQKVFHEADHKLIFMNIMTLWNLHHSFYSDLRHAVLKTLKLSQFNETRPNSFTTADTVCHSRHKDKFIAYGPYCMGLSDSRTRILELEKTDPVVKAKIYECTSSVNDNQFKLQDLLCLPMQRVLKYHILLMELIKSTSFDAPERKSLELAKEAMDDVNSYVNEMKRDNETKQLIEEVQNSITELTMPEDVTLMDYGRLNADGEVRLAESTNQQFGKMKQRHVFIFDKVLIICKANRNNTYTYKSAYIISELHPTLDNPMPDGKMGTISRKIASANQYLLFLVRDERACTQDSVRHLTLAFKVMQQREKWLHHFELARGNVLPEQADSTGHKVHYKSFNYDVPYKCTVCDKLLKGLFFQGYKCENCGSFLHKGCIALRPCVGRRHTTSISHSGPSANGTHWRQSSYGYSRQFNLHVVLICKHQSGLVSAGDHVVALSRYSANEPGFLQFDKDDVIEISQNHGNGIFSGCLLSGRQNVGLIHGEQVRRMRSLNSPRDSFTGFHVDRKDSTVLPRRMFANIMAPTPQQDYVNTEVSLQPWYMGELERADSEVKLKGTPKRYENEVKHTVVEQRDNTIYYLDEGYVFNSIVELVNYYKENNLCESFNSLNTTLKNAYRTCKLYRVIHDFDATEPKFLTLRKGDRLTLVDVIGEDRGWWKGQIADRIGFFPLSYVEPWKE